MTASAKGVASLVWLHALRNLQQQQQQQPLTTTEWGIATALMSYANAHGVCSVAVPTIARTACAADRTVQYAVRRLESLGLLHVERSRGGRPNTYTLLAAPQMVQEPLLMVHGGAPLATRDGARHDTETVHPGAPEEKAKEKTGDEEENDGAADAVQRALPDDLCALLGEVRYDLRDGDRKKLLLLWERDRMAVQQATYEATQKARPSGWFHAWLTGHELPTPKPPRIPPCDHCAVGGGFHLTDCPTGTTSAPAPGRRAALRHEPLVMSPATTHREEKHDDDRQT